MFSIFVSKHVKQGRQFVKDARKLLDYKRDLWTEAQVGEFEKGITILEGAVRDRDKAGIETAARDLDGLCGKLLPAVQNAGWRENCEVFLVAIVVALGVRTYFLQPFTIPTGSMQPTLNGIIGYPTTEPPPNAMVRLFQTAAFGRGWVDVKAKSEGVVAEMTEIKRFLFFTYTRVVVVPTMETPDGPRQIPDRPVETYLIHAPTGKLMESFGLREGKLLKAGDLLARGYVETGDHVFVDKISYHFRTPRRGDVFVFNTQDILMRGARGLNVVAGPPPAEPSQFYIKRLVGLPSDTLQIAAPELFVNGAVAVGASFAKVMAAKDGYRGYANMSGMKYLTTPTDSLTVPPRRYWAMGDNSYFSSDSRDWGSVPQRNIMGRGVFVYWPFASHWGLIK